MRLLRDLQRKRKIEAKKKVVKGIALGTFVGGLLGSSAAILLAPDSGKNTRKKIQDNAKDLKDNVENSINQRKDQVDQSIKSKKEEIRQAVERIKRIGRTSQEDVAATCEPEVVEEQTEKEQ